MDENLYIGEDHDFFYRLNEKIKDLKVYFDKNVFVYHEDREFKFFLMQRFCYGLNVFTSKNTSMKRILALIPFLSIFLLFLLILNFSKFSISIFSFIIILFMCIIFWEINKYVSKFATKLMLVVCIFLSNLFYGLGTIFYLFGLRKLIEKNIYRNIKKKI